jgi:hypothetical protein
VLSFGTQVRGFKPGRSRRDFSGEKILSTPSFGGEVKPSVPCRALRHVKEPKSVTSSVLIPSPGLKKDGASSRAWPYIMFLFSFAKPSSRYFEFRSKCFVHGVTSSVLIPSPGVKKDGALSRAWSYIMFRLSFAMPTTLYFDFLP